MVATTTVQAATLFATKVPKGYSGVLRLRVTYERRLELAIMPHTPWNRATKEAARPPTPRVSLHDRRLPHRLQPGAYEGASSGFRIVTGN